MAKRTNGIGAGLCAVAASGMLSLPGGAAVAQPSRAAVTAAAAQAGPAAALRSFGGLALSAAGDLTATIESAGEGAAAHGVITLRSARDGRIVRTYDPCAKCSYAGLNFAADGRVAFVARDRAAGTASVMVAKDAAVRTVATVAGLASTPRFSPDGTRIAALVTIGAAKETGAVQPGVRQVGEIGEKNDAQRLAVFDAAGPAVAAGAVTPVSPAGRFVYEYDWTPDGRELVATTALGNGDNNWWVATIDAIDAATGAVRPIAKPTTQVNYPQVSPDGRTVAFVGGLMSDFGAVGGDVWTVPVTGGVPRNVTPGVRYTVVSLDWTAGGLRTVALRGERIELGRIDGAAGGGRSAVAGSGRPVTVAAGDGRVAFSADGERAAAVVEDWTHAPAIEAGPLNALRPITRDNAAAPARTRATSLSWRSDGYTVQGWLLAPVTPGAMSRAGKASMIVTVHGGPASASTPRYVGANGLTTDLLERGYYVFYPNPRGSYGQGEAFTAANKRDFGGGDLRDILAGVDAAERVAPIDDARLGLTGGSYGGFMAMWTNTQTDRFKAIVAGAGISNWISYYGTNGIDQWMLPFFGKTLYDDPKAFEDVSAIYRMKRARTPTFIYVGERDIEVPPTQSTEYWHALKDQGVPTSLVIYADEGHGIRQPANARDLRARTLAWFERYLKP